jgi:hypothetical protein
VDKQWTTQAALFIHSLPTGAKPLMHPVIRSLFTSNLLIIKHKKMLSTGVVLLNNNNKITMSNIY